MGNWRDAKTFTEFGWNLTSEELDMFNRGVELLMDEISELGRMETLHTHHRVYNIRSEIVETNDDD